MTPYVAKQLRKMSKADKAAHALVLAYCERYLANRGLVSTFPRVCAAFEHVLTGYPVRNADGGADIAYFTTYEAAQMSVIAARQMLTP